MVLKSERCGGGCRFHALVQLNRAITFVPVLEARARWRSEDVRLIRE